MMQKYVSLINKGIQKPHLVPKFIISKFLRNTIYPVSIFANSRYNVGHNIFDSEWDCLIILDTCRPDALDIVSDEYEFINEITKKWSVGADSSEWMANTFNTKHLEKLKERRITLQTLILSPS